MAILAKTAGSVIDNHRIDDARTVAELVLVVEQICDAKILANDFSISNALGYAGDVVIFMWVSDIRDKLGKYFDPRLLDRIQPPLNTLYKSAGWRCVSDVSSTFQALFVYLRR